MKMPKNIRAVKANHGEKMIELKVCFFTNNIAGHGKVMPKHARCAGVIRIQADNAHGIVSEKSKPSIP
jgi:hypothetical protein